MMDMTGFEDEEVDLTPMFPVLRSEALFLLQKKLYSKTLTQLNKSLDIIHDDVTCLLARAKCYLELGEPEKALEDAHKIVKEDKTITKGLLLKAEAFYQMGYFEFALVYFHRGYKIRPDIQEFGLGIHKCEEAIEHAIGENYEVRLTKEGYDPHFFQEQEKFQNIMDKLDGKKKKKQVTSFTYSKKKQKIEKEVRVQPIKNEKTVKQLLGELYHDKIYLEKIMKETDLPNTWSDTNSCLNKLSMDCLHYLDRRMLLWQQLLPAHNREIARLRRKFQNMQEPKQLIGWALNTLERIQHLNTVGRHDECIQLGKSTLKKLKSSAGPSPDKEVLELCAEIHSLMGNSYLELGNTDKALLHHEYEKSAGETLKDDDIYWRALRNLGQVYTNMGDYETAFSIWSQLLPLTFDALILAWLHHELGQCRLHMEDYMGAIKHGHASLEAAETADSNEWKIRAYVLLGLAYAKLGDYKKAETYYMEGLRTAVRIKDSNMQHHIENAMKELKKLISKAAPRKSGIGPVEQALRPDRSKEKLLTNPEISSFQADYGTMEHNREKKRSSAFTDNLGYKKKKWANQMGKEESPASKLRTTGGKRMDDPKHKSSAGRARDGSVSKDGAPTKGKVGQGTERKTSDAGAKAKSKETTGAKSAGKITTKDKSSKGGVPTTQGSKGHTSAKSGSKKDVQKKKFNKTDSRTSLGRLDSRNKIQPDVGTTASASAAAGGAAGGGAPGGEEVTGERDDITAGAAKEEAGRDEAGGRIDGDDGQAGQKVQEMAGQRSEDSVRPTSVAGEDGDGSVAGQVTPADEKQQGGTGQEASADGKRGSVTGQDISSDGKRGSVTGQDISSDGKRGSVTGQEASSDGKRGSVTGQEASADGKSGSVTGQEASSDGKRGSVTGQEASADGKEPGAGGQETSADSKQDRKASLSTEAEPAEDEGSSSPWTGDEGKVGPAREQEDGGLSGHEAGGETSSGQEKEGDTTSSGETARGETARGETSAGQGETSSGSQEEVITTTTTRRETIVIEETDTSSTPAQDSAD